MNKKRIVGVALAVGACGVLAAAGMMLSKKSGAVVLDQAGNEIAKLILQDGKISYECEDKYQSYADIVSQDVIWSLSPYNTSVGIFQARGFFLT